MAANWFSKLQLLAFIRHLGGCGAGRHAGGAVALGTKDLACTLSIDELGDELVQRAAVALVDSAHNQIAVVVLLHR